MEVPPWAIFSLACLAALPFLFKIFSRHRNHPPGPKPWPVIGNFHLLGPLPHHSLHKLSQKYGPIMQLSFGSVPVVVASSSEAAKLFLKTYDHVFANRPQTAAGRLTGNNHASVIWAPYGPSLRQWRKILQSELFSLKRIEAYEYIRMEEVRALMLRIYASFGKPVPLRRQLSCFTLSIMSRVVLGKKYFSDSKDVKSIIQLEEFQEMIEEFILLNGVFYIGDWIPWLGNFLDFQGYVKRMKVVNEKFNRYFDYVFEDHMSKKEAEKERDFEGRNIVDFLLELLDDPSLEVKLTYDKLKTFAQDLLIGGTETTASTVEWAMSELLKNPHVMEKASEELDRVIGRERWVEEKDIPRLAYIDAIMKEAMRKRPVASTLGMHEALEDCKVEGYDIKRGTILLVNLWSLGRDDRVWENPEEFRPERFLGKAIDVRGQTFELLPFGSGRRMCPSYNFALRMIMCCLANLLHGFKWELPAEHNVEDMSLEETYGISTTRKFPLVGVPKPRLPFHLYQQ
ncbi:trimethyltridecatetraene synthase [Ziziphus jujuba]|uniref:Trimethyltridecatetraene synthase n=1 Tax=Ziziphus jujuba TaxID=326968 RepID=A0A6P4ASC6_ZIZJJ|nr:trimethyltridecatetraene synthase [Ziziphus jujuba]